MSMFRMRHGISAVLMLALGSCSDDGPADSSDRVVADVAEAPNTQVVDTTAATDTAVSSTEVSTTLIDRPRVDDVEGPTVVSNFGRVDLTVGVEARFDNPFDQRQVALDSEFEGPDGSTWNVAGFWDGRENWNIRFTPSLAGPWTYSVTVADHRGTSLPSVGGFDVEESDAKGWIRVGDQVDPSYSNRYLAHLDGTPWFGLGHADLDMGFGGYDGTTFNKMAEMPAVGENFEMWWPLWTFNFIQNAHDNYQPAQMELIDLVLDEAEANDITIAYTIWNHQLLRTNNHRWGRGLWNSNGFGGLVDVDEFFTDPEAWAWQENLYRYTIARWGASPAIAMWQTVTEINGTESYEHTDAWHERVNRFFVDHDPYRHPTTATKSGGEYWPTAYDVMDVPQMHVYEQFHQNPVEAAKIMADWTQQMWAGHDKPNWIGEYGERSPRSYPEFFHNATWAAIAAGASIGPIEWNDKNSYGQFDDVMGADQARVRQFLDTVDLVAIDPVPVAISSATDDIRGWGVAGADGGIIWVQDAALEATDHLTDEDIDAIRARPPRSNVAVHIEGLVAADFVATPFDTRSGEWSTPIDLVCSSDGSCSVTLPTFTHDLALRLDRV